VYYIDPDILWHNLRYRTWDRPSISYTISAYDIEYRKDETSISTTIIMTCDIEGLSPSISNNVTFDIEHLRYRHTISKVQNVDIEWTFDIEVFDIECYARNPRSDPRYRGGKDPDVWELEAGAGAILRPVANLKHATWRGPTNIIGTELSRMTSPFNWQWTAWQWNLLILDLRHFMLLIELLQSDLLRHEHSSEILTPWMNSLILLCTEYILGTYYAIGCAGYALSHS
jgi:hypothetical protein